MFNHLFYLNFLWALKWSKAFFEYLEYSYFPKNNSNYLVSERVFENSFEPKWKILSCWTMNLNFSYCEEHENLAYGIVEVGESGLLWKEK